MIRVLAVDDEELVRTGLHLILRSVADIQLVAEAPEGHDAVAATLRHHPDVVLIDVRMPGLDGLAATEQITRLPDPAHVIVLATFDLDEYVHRALRAGACGFLLKSTLPREFVPAVRAVAAGDAMVAPAVTRRLIRTFAERQPERAEAARARFAGLTEREDRVARAAAAGLSNVEISRELSMSEGTVKAHISRSLAKLGLANRVQIAILAHEAGLVR
jgi:DNA-binding NarL/FixJ family response regulator